LVSEHIRKDEVGGYVLLRERKELHTKFWWGNFKEGDRLEGIGLDYIILLK
jgi:hypothetical protein